MRYHFGLGVGHSFTRPASCTLHQQSASTSQMDSQEELGHQRPDEEHNCSIFIPWCLEEELSSGSSTSVEEDDRSSNDYSLDLDDDDSGFGEDEEDEIEDEEFYGMYYYLS